MKLVKTLTTPPWFALGLGVPAFGLMAVLMRTGVDERELFIPGHFAGIGLWILTAAMVALTAVSAPRYNGKAKYFRMFPGSVPAAAGILGAALGVLGEAWALWSAGGEMLEPAAAVLGLMAGVALIWLAWCRRWGIRGSFLLWGLVTGFLMLRLLLCYRDWSAQPELLRYCFPMFASVCVTLAFYYRTAFSLEMSNRRLYLALTQMGAFFCLVTLGSGFSLFYLGMLAWCLLDLTTLRPFTAAVRGEAAEEQP